MQSLKENIQEGVPGSLQNSRLRMPYQSVPDHGNHSQLFSKILSGDARLPKGLCFLLSN